MVAIDLLLKKYAYKDKYFFRKFPVIVCFLYCYVLMVKKKDKDSITNN